MIEEAGVLNKLNKALREIPSHITNLRHKYKKNQNIISKCVSIALIALFLFLTGYIGLTIYNSDKALAAGVREKDKKSPLEENKERDYGESGLNVFAENDSFILYADITNGEIAVEEKKNGKIWYSNPEDREEDTVAPLKTRLDSQIVVTCLTLPDDSLKGSKKVEGNVETTADSLSGCVKLGGLDYEPVAGGIKFIYTFPKYGIRVPVQYLITEEGFAAEVLVNEVEELWTDRYILLKIDLLPFFGAGGLDDEGYLFVPDGSGALIHFNNGKQRFMQYSDPVYGRDDVEPSKTALPKNEQIAMPVFGLKTNDHAFLAVITSGDELAQITALPSRKLSSYNQVYSTLTCRTYSKRSGDDKIKIQNKGISVAQYSDPLFDSGRSYRVDYFMLSGEEADYSGMAHRYRKYLTDRGLLKNSGLADKSYFMLNVYGAVSIEKYVMGIKKQVVTALTTYREVAEIVKDLKANGVNDIIVNYIGAMDGGLDEKPMNQFETERTLGSKKDFETMKDYLEQENVLLFIESDPVSLHKSGNGYQTNGHSSLYFYDSYSFLYDYSLNLNKAEELTRWNLLKPSLLVQFTDQFFASAKKNGLKNYSAAEIGSRLYSDYDADSYSTRIQSGEFWKEALTNASERFDYVMLAGGNAYGLAYADVIRDVAFEFSNYDITDESIPFYQMVLRGNVAMGAPSLNMGSDYHYRFLKSLETGCNLSYTWIAGDVVSLVGTKYNELVSTSLNYWFDTAVQEYHDASEFMELTAGKAILSHRKLAQDVFETVYEGGIRVTVNYSWTDYENGEVCVEARNYTISGNDMISGSDTASAGNAASALKEGRSEQPGASRKRRLRAERKSAPKGRLL